MVIIFCIYAFFGYLAVPHTIWRDKMILGYEFGDIFFRRLTCAIVLGWILIPWWIILKLTGYE